MSLSSKLRVARGTEIKSEVTKNIKPTLPTYTVPQGVETDDAIRNFPLEAERERRLDTALKTGVALPSGRVVTPLGRTQTTGESLAKKVADSQGSYADRRDTRLYVDEVKRKEEKGVREKAKQQAEILAKEIKDKYGVEAKRKYSPFQILKGEMDVPENLKEQFKKDFTEYTLAIERSDPFGAGANTGFNVLPTFLETTEGSETVKEAPGFGAGRFVGGVGQQAAFASVLGAPLQGAFGKLLPSASPIVTETLKDVAIGTGTQLLEQPFDKTTPTQMLGNAALDIAINVVLGKLGKAFANASELASAKTPDVVEQVARELNVTNEQADQIIDNASVMYVNQFGTVSDKPFEQLQLPAPDKRWSDFKKWTKKNFNEIPENFSDEDVKALQELYNQEKGLTPVNVDRPREVPRTVTPGEMSKSFSQKVAESKIETPAIKAVEAPVETPRVETPIIEPARVEPVFEPSAPRVEPTFRAETPFTGTSEAKFTDTARKSAQTTDELRTKIKDVELNTTTNEARLREAERLVDENFDASLNLVREGEKFTSDMEGAIGNILYGKLQQQGRYDEAIQIIESLSRKARKAGQDIQILSLWSKTTPEGMARWATKTLNEAGVDVNPKLIAEITENVRISQEATPEQLSELIKKQIKNKTERDLIDGFIKGENGQYLKELNIAMNMRKITDQLPIAVARKLSTVQAMSHLLNVKTFSRNILGNTASITLEQLSKMPASAADSFISLFTGNRTLVAKGPRWKQAAQQAFKEGKRSATEIFLGVNRATQDKYDLFFESAFKDKGLGKVGRGLEKALSLSLNTPDEFFKGFVKADSIYNQVRARLGKEVDEMDFGTLLNKATPEEIKLAVDEAKYATFQNDSLPAKVLTKLKQTLNYVGIGKTSKSGIKEFGLGDLVVKYTRVPGNLIARGVEYSPLGYAKMLTALGQPMTPQAQRQIAQVFGRATTGSGLAAVGYLLTKAGVVEPVDDLTYDEAALARSEGKGNYKINVSGLGRLITGQDPTPKAGDKFKSYDWINPLNVPFSAGSQIANFDGKDFTPEQAARAFSSSTMEQALDLPTMFIIQSMMNEARNEDNDWFDVATVPLKQALPGFVPSPVRQFSQVIDPVIRETKGKDSAETARNQIVANIPFLSKTLEPKLSPLGKEQVRDTNIFSAMVSPATTTTYEPVAFSKALEEVKTLTGKTNFYPNRQAPRTFDYKKGNVKETLELTPEERTLYQKTYGEEVERKYTAILTPASYRNLNVAEETAKRLSEVETEAREKAKNAVLKKRGLR